MPNETYFVVCRQMKQRTSMATKGGDCGGLMSVLLVLVTSWSGCFVLAIDWISSPATQVRPLNGTATFDCLIGGGGVGDRTVLWTKTTDDDERRTLFINDDTFDAPTRYRSTRAQDGSGYRLTIDRIDTNDDAQYACEIQQLGKASARLTVLGNCCCIYSTLVW